MLNHRALHLAALTLISCMLANTAALTQEIKVTLLGTGTPIVNFNRFGMSTLVEAGSQKLLFDAGRGVVLRLQQKGASIRDINGIFITHLHSDHLTGLPDLYATAELLPLAIGGRKTPLDVWGPSGIGNVGPWHRADVHGQQSISCDRWRGRAGRDTHRGARIIGGGCL